jgi:hypothetical protein
MENSKKSRLGHAALNNFFSEPWDSLLEWNPLLWAFVFAIPVHLLAVIFSDNPVTGIASGVGVGLFVALRRHTLIKDLRARASSLSPPTWDIYIGHEVVGKVADSELAALRLRILSDVKIYGAQVLNTGLVAVKAFWSCCFMLSLVVLVRERRSSVCSL